MRDQAEILWRIKVCWTAGAAPGRLEPMLGQLDDQHAARLTGWRRGLGGPTVRVRRRGGVPRGDAELEQAAHRTWRIACRRLMQRSPLAGEAIAHLYEWLWLLGRDDVCAAMARAPWEGVGAPKLGAAARAMRWTWPPVDGDPTTDAEVALARHWQADPVPESSRPVGREASPADAGEEPSHEGKGMHYPTAMMRSRGLRYAAAAAALLISLVALLAFTATPARATVVSSASLVDDCDGTTVTITSGMILPTYEWTVTVAGEQFWPGDDDAQPAPGDSVDVLVPARAGQIQVDFKGSPKGWPKTGEWQHPGGDACGTPSVTVEGDCEQVVVTYSNPTGHYFSGDHRVDGEPGTSDQWSDMEIKEGPHAGELFGDRYHEVDLPPGQTETVELTLEPGSGEQTVEAVIRRGAEQRWYTEWVTLTVDCGQPTPTPAPTTTSSPPPGGGGQLAQTGASVPMIGGGALGLLTLGGGLYLVARRRRTRFTA